MDISIDQLRTLASAGDARALATLGRRLLMGEGTPPSPFEAIGHLKQAAQRDDGEAATLLAGLAAQGLLEPSDFGKALDLLLQGAERGWADAQQQLQLLARADGQDWRGLRRSADIAMLARPPARRALSEEPRIRVFENFATEAECTWLIDRARNALKPAQIYHALEETRPYDIRTNTEAELSLDALDVVSAVLFDRVAAAVGVPRPFCEIPKLMHYEPGQQFQVHSDFFDEDMHPEEIRLRGQRIATLLIYLNDDYDAGETEFVRANIRFKGRRGDALLFVNVGAAGKADPSTFHAGLPPTRGEKWLFSQWVRDKPMNPFMTPGGEAAILAPNWRDSM